MQAVVLTRFGGPDVLACSTVERPVPGEDQMLVRVAACGICGADLLARAGHFPRFHPPCVIGHEIAGRVEEAGAAVTGFKPGDRVALMQRLSCGRCAMCLAGRGNLCRSGMGLYGERTPGGGAEFVLATERNAVHLPDAISYETGAILSCGVGTGLHALARARLGAGDTVVVTAASGGVGIHTVAAAHALGHRVIAVTTSEAKAALVREAGADEVIVAPDALYHDSLFQIQGHASVDAVIEVAGAPTFESSIRVLKQGGRLVMVGNVAPGAVPLNPAHLILKEIELIGSAHAVTPDLQRVVDLVRRGLVRPRVAGSLPVERAAEAHRLVEETRPMGRFVLTHGWAQAA